MKDRHLLGTGAAACAVCCAPLVLPLLGIAGAVATLATVVFAGLAFGLVVLAATLLALWAHRRRAAPSAPCEDGGQADLTIGPPPHAG